MKYIRRKAMYLNNPFAINFGIIPSQYIERDYITEEIIGELLSPTVRNSCFMLTGIRGSGKTVELTSIERIVKEMDEWIVIGLNPEREMLQSLVAKLYDTNKYLKKFISAEVNLSKFGIGLELKNVPPVADVESALEIILREIKKKGKKLLVTIDEVSNTAYMRELSSTFQLLIRQELPIYIIMAGLYENIHNLENADNLTFLYRAPKYEIDSLNITLIQQRYMRIFSKSKEEALEMAKITKGYAFAYQALGKYIWESPERSLDEEVLAKFDAALERYVYTKIWSELSEMDRWYVSFIAKKNSMDVKELLEITNKKKNEFSQYRARLQDKGIIDTSIRGVISMKLPRFDVFVEKMLE